MPGRLSLVGQRYGRLIVEEMIYGGGNGKARCRCDCGGSVVALAYNVRNGNTSSCGCLSTEARIERGRRLGPVQGKKNATHGMSSSVTYAKWRDARNRCFRAKDQHFAYYGGRGITMCPAWAASFEAFFADMGEAPPGMTLERDDVNGNYEPGNCRWASKLVQARNKRRTIADWPMVCEIRARRSAGEAAAALAHAFGMSVANVQAIVSFQTWKEPT